MDAAALDTIKSMSSQGPASTAGAIMLANPCGSKPVRGNWLAPKHAMTTRLPMAAARRVWRALAACRISDGHVPHGLHATVAEASADATRPVRPMDGIAAICSKTRFRCCLKAIPARDASPNHWDEYHSGGAALSSPSTVNPREIACRSKACVNPASSRRFRRHRETEARPWQSPATFREHRLAGQAPAFSNCEMPSAIATPPAD